ncbi:hypothetical protein HMPREF1531_00033 [Propionibacterium sp. oral taxon 192 str. F0372]|nr:hypothetical protein [Propionibacterium sp. oral taxon 192]EPH06989.1 hypothetical protein HMPREF1531_00033 [Propionibacterium sp. oral taxon 192 str. F0372]
MSAIADLASDERRARVLLSLLAEPDDATAGRLPSYVALSKR